MVSTSAPWHCTVSTVHDLTDMPFRSTVQAPQCEVSQPMCGPVCARRSRRLWISSSRGSTTTSTALPLSVNDTVCLLAMVCSSGSAFVRGAQRTLRHLAGHRGLVLDVAALVLDRI